MLAARGHVDDRWGDYPYLTHLALVAEKVRALFGADEAALMAAWLHDLYEDHPEYQNEIQRRFPELWKTLFLLARDPETEYLDYVQAVIDSGDRRALLVKYADLLTNLGHGPKRQSLRERYRTAIKMIEETGQLPTR